MFCQRCGRQNPDDASICNSCGFILTGRSTINPEVKAKTSKTAIIAVALLVIFSILSFISAVFYSTQIVILTGILPVIFGIKSWIDIKKSNGRLKGKSLAIAGVITPLVFMPIFIAWTIDASPIPNDYTITNLRSAPPQCARSYDILMSLAYKGEHSPKDAPAIGLSEQDINLTREINNIIKEGNCQKITEVLKANADNIHQAWTNAQKGRDIINELNKFPEIADLTEPDFDAEMRFTRNLRNLAYLYQAYAYIQTEQGKAQNVVSELIELDSVFRKLSINARSLVMKLLCIAGLNISIRTANFTVNNPQTPEQSLELLAEHFTPLKNTHISLRNPLTFEYLIFKKSLDELFYQQDMQKRPSILKRNSTLRLYKNFCDHWIDAWAESGESGNAKLSVWPGIYPDWLPSASVTSEGQVPWCYKCYNPIGSILIQILTPALEKVFEFQTKLNVQDDLFQIVLNKRFGKTISLKARAYSDEYIIDTDKKIIFSPGPDGKVNTKDDIKLPINPEVLNLKD